MKSICKADTAPRRLLGKIFSLVGAFNLSIGGAASLVMKSAGSEMWYLPLAIMGWIGLVFLVMGLAFIGIEKRRQAADEELKNHGRVLEATVTGVQCNYNITVNSRHPYYAEAQWQDPVTGTVHIFRSRELNFDPLGYVEGRKVAVYVRDNDYAHYYVDLDPILPRVEIH